MPLHVRLLPPTLLGVQPDLPRSSPRTRPSSRRPPTVGAYWSGGTLFDYSARGARVTTARSRRGAAASATLSISLRPPLAWNASLDEAALRDAFAPAAAAAADPHGFAQAVRPLRPPPPHVGDRAAVALPARARQPRRDARPDRAHAAGRRDHRRRPRQPDRRPPLRTDALGGAAAVARRRRSAPPLALNATEDAGRDRGAPT